MKLAVQILVLFVVIARKTMGGGFKFLYQKTPIKSTDLCTTGVFFFVKSLWVCMPCQKSCMAAPSQHHLKCCERINSCAHQIFTLRNTVLGDGKMENLKIVVSHASRLYSSLHAQASPNHKSLTNSPNLEYSKRRTTRRSRRNRVLIQI